MPRVGVAKSILLVEDEADVARYLAAALEDEGHEVRTAANAAIGLEEIHRRRPDLICLDLVMPGRTGLSLYRELRLDADLADVPIFVVSGVNPVDAAHKLGLGESLPQPQAFIEKPVDLARFLATVEELFDG